jgi:lactam utilization protein B
MPALTCTPANLESTKACLRCLSEKELKAIIAYAFRTSAGLTVAQVKNNSACYRCMSKKDMLVALTAMIVNQLVPRLSVNDLSNATACKACGSDKEYEAAMLYLFCNYFQSIGD